MIAFICIIVGILLGAFAAWKYRAREKRAWAYAVHTSLEAKSKADAEVVRYMNEAAAVKTFLTSHVAQLEAFIGGFEVKVAESAAKAKAELELIIEKAKKI